jgi:hypothetical protein
MLTKRLRLPLLLALAAVPFGADVASAKSAKFTASFEARYTTSWDMKKHLTGASCFRQNFSRGNGSESWTVKSRGNTKVMLEKLTYNVAAKYGTFGRFASGESGIEGAGLHTRDGATIISWEPGECGGTSGFNKHPDDCGTRLPKYHIAFRDLGRSQKPYPELFDASGSREKTRFETCEVRLPGPLADGVWPEVRATPPKKKKAPKLFGTAKTITYTGSKTWKWVGYQGTPHEENRTSTLVWKLVLKRVKR